MSSDENLREVPLDNDSFQTQPQPRRVGYNVTDVLINFLESRLPSGDSIVAREVVIIFQSHLMGGRRLRKGL